MTATIKVLASPESWIEQIALDQLERTAGLDGIEQIVAMPDLHAGVGIAVGAAYWSRGFIHPHLVGGDIGCGMALWRCDLPLHKFRPDTAERKLHGLEQPDDAGLGTIGGGNHFAELLRIESLFAPTPGLDPDRLYLMVHSGSRGLGQEIRDRYPALLPEQEAGAYLAEQDAALDWAVRNRQAIAERFFDRLHLNGERLLDLCHNSVTRYRDGWLHRKGAAPADQGLVVIPGSRGDLSWLVRPRPEAAETALHSLAHGAGRKWNRREARARLSRRFTVAELQRTKLGSRVICEDRDLLYEEAPPAYKDIAQVIRDLDRFGLIEPVATLRPLLTYKVRRE